MQNMKNNRILDFINALQILYKYICFRQKLSKIFPNLNINSFRNINFYNFEDMLKNIFFNVKRYDINVIEYLDDLKKEYGDLDLNKVKEAIDILKQFYVLDRNLINILKLYVIEFGINFDNIRYLLGLTKQSSIENREDYDIEDEDEIDIDISTEKLNNILKNNK